MPDPNDPNKLITVDAEYQTVIYVSDMQEIVDPRTGREIGQNKGYRDAWARKIDVQKKTAFNHPTRQASIFVFPDNSWGEAGFRKYMIPEGAGEGGSAATENFTPTPELVPFLQNLDSLNLLSCVYYEIFNLVNDKPGNCFVFCDYVDFGAILLGEVFKQQGYAKFDQGHSIFKGKDELGPVCAGRGYDSNRKVSIAKAPRFALLTSKSVKSHIDFTMEAFNSYENRHGEYIKVLIGSPTSRDGINLSNVVQVHLASAGWNPSSTYQAISRAIRATSHVDLIAEERKRQATEVFLALPDDERLQRIEDLEAEGYTDDDAQEEALRRIGAELNIKIDIEIYKHAPRAILRYVADGTPVYNSISIEFYMRSERKEVEIQRVMRIIKQCSVDCQVHRARNIRATDVDYTPECDYDVCQYECSDQVLGRAPPVPPGFDEFNNETYDVLYSDPLVQEIIKGITELFQSEFSMSLSNLYKAFPEYRAKFVVMALAKIIAEKRTLHDRYGFPSYLRIDGPIVYLYRDYPLGNDGKYPINEYVRTLVSVKDVSISSLTQEMRKESQADIVETVKTEDPTSEQFAHDTDQLDLEKRIALVEEAVATVLEYPEGLPPEKQYAQALWNRYTNFIYTLNEPVERLEKAKEIMGRPLEKTKKNELKERQKLAVEKTLDLDARPSDPLVHVHMLNSVKGGNVAYNDMARIRKADGKLRLFAPDAEGVWSWRDMRPYEEPIYRNILQRLIADHMQLFDEYSIYGIIKPDGKFLIRDRRNEPKELKDKRSRKSGRECESFVKPILIDFLWELKIPSDEEFAELPSDNDMREYLYRVSGKQATIKPDEMTEDQLIFYYTWHKTGTKKSICAKLESELAEKQMIDYI